MLRSSQQTNEQTNTLSTLPPLYTRLSHHKVETLRKQALAEVGVRQFSAEGLYRDPCVSFVLPDVICSFCNLCRDLDLCRDSRLMDEDEVRSCADLRRNVWRLDTLNFTSFAFPAEYIARAAFYPVVRPTAAYRPAVVLVPQAS